MATAIAITEGTEITLHQRLIDAKPPLRTVDGEPLSPVACGGSMLAQAGDTGRGPVWTACSSCGYVMALGRRSEFTTPRLVAVGDGVASEDGYARF